MQDAPALSDAGVKVVKLDYLNQEQLVGALEGVHTVLCFFSSDPGNLGQKALIDACITAGVKRFAPSEWGMCVFLLSSFRRLLDACQPLIDASLYQG